MSIANTEASVINKLANCKPPVLAKQKMKQFNIHVNLKTWKTRNCGAVRETMVKVECSIVLNVLCTSQTMSITLKYFTLGLEMKT